MEKSFQKQQKGQLVVCVRVLNLSCLNLKLTFDIQEGIVEEEINGAEVESVFYGHTEIRLRIVLSAIPLGGQELAEGVINSLCMPGGCAKVVDRTFGPLAGCVLCWH